MKLISIFMLAFAVGCSGSSATSSTGGTGSAGGGSGSTSSTTRGSTSTGTSGLASGEAQLGGSLAWSPASADMARVLISDGGQGYDPSHLEVEVDGEGMPDCQGRGAPPDAPVLRLEVAVASNQSVQPGSYADAQLTASELTLGDGGALFPGTGPVTHSSVTLTGVSPDVVGTFSLDFGDGNTLTGAFDAPFCNP